MWCMSLAFNIYAHTDSRRTEGALERIPANRFPNRPCAWSRATASSTEPPCQQTHFSFATRRVETKKGKRDSVPHSFLKKVCFASDVDLDINVQFALLWGSACSRCLPNNSADLVSWANFFLHVADFHDFSCHCTEVWDFFSASCFVIYEVEVKGTMFYNTRGWVWIEGRVDTFVCFCLYYVPP